MTTAWSSKAGRVRLHGLATRYAFYNQPLVAKRLAEEAVRVGSGEMDLHEEEFAHTLYQALCATPFQIASEVAKVQEIASAGWNDFNVGDVAADAQFSTLVMSDIAEPREYHTRLMINRNGYYVDCPAFDPTKFASADTFRCMVYGLEEGVLRHVNYATYQRLGFTFRQEFKVVPSAAWLAIQKAMTAAFDAGPCRDCGSAGPHSNGGHVIDGAFVATCRVCDAFVHFDPPARVYRVESMLHEATYHMSLDSLFARYSDLSETDIFRTKRLLTSGRSLTIYSGDKREPFTVVRYANIQDAEKQVHS